MDGEREDQTTSSLSEKYVDQDELFISVSSDRLHLWLWKFSSPCRPLRSSSCARCRVTGEAPIFTPSSASSRRSPLPWKRLYLKVWVHYFHKSHILNELQLIQNMMLVNSKLPKTFEIITQMSDSVFFPMVPPLHIGWKTDGRLIESGVSFYPILLYFTM